MKKHKFGRFFGYAFRQLIKPLKETWKGNGLWSIIAVILSYFFLTPNEISSEARIGISLVAGTIFTQIIKYMVLLLFAPVKILQEQERLIENYEKTTNRTGVIMRLSELRKKGVELRNEGERLLHPDSVKPWWNDKFAGWKLEVISTMAILDPVQANQWGTLGTYTRKRTFPRALNPQHAHYLEMFDAWLERLQDRIEGFGIDVI